MFFWNFNFLFLKTRLFNSVRFKKTKLTFIKRSKFVREQKTFSKSNKGPLKSRSNVLIRVLVFSLNGVVTNTPPLSTNLTLFGLNSQKFCEEFNNTLKSLYFPDILSNLTFKVFLYIYKDLSFKIIIHHLKLTHLFLSIISLNLNKVILSNLIKVNSEIDYTRVFSLSDFWIFYRISRNFISATSNESFIRSFASFAKSLNRGFYYRNIFFVK